MNAHPSTPFGRFFNNIGIWRPSIEEAIESLYNNLHDTEKTAVKDASGWIAIINANLQGAPDFVFDLIQKKFPGVTKDSAAGTLNKVNAALMKMDADTPDNFEGALGKLQSYLSKYEGNTWIAMTKAVVTVLADVFLKGASPIQSIETVLEYVYRTFIKGKVAAVAA